MKNVYENPAVEVIYLDVLDVLSYSVGSNIDDGGFDSETVANGRNPIIWG